MKKKLFGYGFLAVAITMTVLYLWDEKNEKNEYYRMFNL